ncbi:MAG: hypothetical protein WBZ19_16105, partial [Chthoniobacterales bacterium]
ARSTGGDPVGLASEAALLRKSQRLVRATFAAIETQTGVVARFCRSLRSDDKTNHKDFEGGKVEMDPMNSIWYYTEFQRQLGERSSPQDFGETPSSSVEPLSRGALAKPDVRPGGSQRDWLIDLGLPVLVFVAVICFGLLCFLFPTFLN